MRWSSHSEAMLQAALDDIDWHMFRANSSDVSKFTDVAISNVNMLSEQATETVTIRTFSNQKPWVDRTVHDTVNKCTAAYNASHLSGNMSEYSNVEIVGNEAAYLDEVERLTSWCQDNFIAL